jgi:hypothetical protein
MEPTRLRGHAGGVDDEHQIPAGWGDGRRRRELESEFVGSGDLEGDVDEPLLVWA